MEYILFFSDMLFPGVYSVVARLNILSVLTFSMACTTSNPQQGKGVKAFTL
jgi:hypothetical protein